MTDNRWSMSGAPTGDECDTCTNAGRICYHPRTTCTCGRPGLDTALHLTPCALRVET